MVDQFLHHLDLPPIERLHQFVLVDFDEHLAQVFGEYVSQVASRLFPLGEVLRFRLRRGVLQQNTERPSYSHSLKLFLVGLHLAVPLLD